MTLQQRVRRKPRRHSVAEALTRHRPAPNLPPADRPLPFGPAE